MRLFDMFMPKPKDSEISTQGYPGPDPYDQGPQLYRLPVGAGDPDMSIGGGNSMQAVNRRNIPTIGGGDTGWYNPALGCWKAFHYGERKIPGRTYLASIPQRAFSEWLR